MVGSLRPCGDGGGLRTGPSGGEGRTQDAPLSSWGAWAEGRAREACGAGREGEGSEAGLPRPAVLLRSVWDRVHTYCLHKAISGSFPCSEQPFALFQEGWARRCFISGSSLGSLGYISCDGGRVEEGQESADLHLRVAPTGHRCRSLVAAVHGSENSEEVAWPLGAEPAVPGVWGAGHLTRRAIFPPISPGAPAPPLPGEHGPSACVQGSTLPEGFPPDLYSCPPPLLKNQCTRK